MFSAIGDGAIRTNIIAFGADQLQEPVLKSRFLDKFVIVLHLAAILDTIAKLYIPFDIDIFQFYLIATLTLLVATLLFLVGWRYYIHTKPYDSVIANCIPVYKNAFQTWRQYNRNEYNIERNYTNIFPGITNEETDERPSTFLDYAKVVNNGKFLDRIVDDVKILQRTFIIFFVLVFPYTLIFSQVKEIIS